MAEHVRVCKREYESLGGGVGDDTSFIDEIDPHEDHIDARGVFLQPDSPAAADEAVHLNRDSSDRMTVKDSEITTAQTIRQLRTAQLLYTGAETIGKTLQTNGAAGVQLADVVSGYPAAFATHPLAGPIINDINSWVEAHSVTTPELEVGSYLIRARMVLSGSKSNTQMEVQCQIDNTETFGELTAVAGVALFGQCNSDETILVVSTPAVHTIDIDFKQPGGSGYTSISGMRITYWRVSG